MNTAEHPPPLRVALSLSPSDAQRLTRLQEAFNRGCNFLAPIARAHRCWSRVALHHLGYKALREAQPELGGQMTCNAIYAVCRACLAIYQNPAQPWGPKARQPTALPAIVFSSRAPVFLDRHTLTIKDKQASIYTLEGRLHCPLPISPETQDRLHTEHVVQTTLLSDGSGFVLEFQFETGLPQRARNRPRTLVPTEAALTPHLQIQATSADAQPLPLT